MNNIVGYTSCKNVQTSKIVFYMSPYEIPDLYEELDFYIIMANNVQFVNNYMVSEHCVLSKKFTRNDMFAFITDGVHSFSNGNNYCYKNGVLHSENDRPAVETNTCKKWMKGGLLHRDNDLPAIDDTLYGVRYWYNTGLLDRENDLPAIEYNNGSKHWYKKGLKHRDNDLPASIYLPEDIQIWYNNNVFVKKVIRNPIFS